MSATILPFNGHGNIKRKEQEPAREQRETLDLQGAREAIEERGESIGIYFQWATEKVWASVANWYEAFAYGAKHAAHKLREFEEKWTPEKLQRLKDEPVILPDVYEDVIGHIAFLKDVRYFYERCAQIYKEEMREVEKLEQAARERAAERIEQEFPHDQDVPDALRKNNFQGWTFEFDWQ